MDYVDSVLPTEQVRWIILWQHVRVQVLCINTCITCTISTHHVSIYTTRYFLKSIMDFLSYTGQLTKNSETNIERNLAWIKIVDNQVQCIYLAQNLLFDEFHFTQWIKWYNSAFLVNLWKNEWNHQPADVLIAPLPGIGLTIQTYKQ